jgi:hypothetical protein
MKFNSTLCHIARNQFLVLASVVDPKLFVTDPDPNFQRATEI